jgi:hypothetical protein
MDITRRDQTYTGASDRRIDDLIDLAEQGIARTCQMCGAPGRTRTGSWIKTVGDALVSER